MRGVTAHATRKPCACKQHLAKLSGTVNTTNLVVRHRPLDRLLRFPLCPLLHTPDDFTLPRIHNRLSRGRLEGMYNTSICDWNSIPDGTTTAPHPFCATGSSANNSATLGACCGTPIAPYDGVDFTTPGTGCYVYCNASKADLTTIMNCMHADAHVISICGFRSTADRLRNSSTARLALNNVFYLSSARQPQPTWATPDSGRVGKVALVGRRSRITTLLGPQGISVKVYTQPVRVDDITATVRLGAQPVVDLTGANPQGRIRTVVLEDPCRSPVQQSKALLFTASQYPRTSAGQDTNGPVFLSSNRKRQYVRQLCRKLLRRAPGPKRPAPQPHILQCCHNICVDCK
ncbi:hypothetical protein K491DRAFT_675460 [Lophiostoma macrostomum CBS 122681]|uniref:Uncharacterized protein n=1 Tax=Lophiostoma macrostomum CBS 122681 TaxID=1314788 RepID=A0A6A6THJ8_9PLEO|nr:hypothetical protein K491DRAFT_675460 [Lophiostoma macrostomum CBS 122681]